MHVNVITGGQIDEYLRFWQPAISIILYVALYLLLAIWEEIKYDDDDTVQRNSRNFLQS